MSQLQAAKTFIRWTEKQFPIWDLPAELVEASIAQGVLDWLDNPGESIDALIAARDLLGSYTLAKCEAIECDPAIVFKLYRRLKDTCASDREATA